MVKQIKTAIKSRRSWQHMVSEDEHSRNHELYTTETRDIEQQTWISEIRNDERKDPHKKKTN